MTLTSNPSPNQTNVISTWLFSCAALVFVMVVIGAITRLTESGLSIVVWEPVTGVIPPLNQAQWQEAFALYQQSPEFQKKNFWMELEDFKTIFFWEWLHRFMGRLIGLAYALPFFWFLIKGTVPAGQRMALFGLLLLGGAQGLMGWFMVQSGLIDLPAVSHYRLAAHLSLAFLILCLLVWYGLKFAQIPRRPNKALFFHSVAVMFLVFLAILWGAFVAGLDAGMIYNEYPLMGGHFVPPDMWFLTPAWLNLLENPAAVQFFHRLAAVIAALGLISLWINGMRRGCAFPALHGLALMAVVQIGLGIATILSGVHIAFATLHQSGAMIILILLAICLYRFRAGASKAS